MLEVAKDELLPALEPAMQNYKQTLVVLKSETVKRMDNQGGNSMIRKSRKADRSGVEKVWKGLPSFGLRWLNVLVLTKS